MGSPKVYATTFMDLCAAGTPLLAIARCMHDPDSCKDQLHFAQAVGKQHRKCVLGQITHLPALKLACAGRSVSDTRAVARLLPQLKNVECARAAWEEGTNEMLCDSDGLMLLRLYLPRLKELDVCNLSDAADCASLFQSVSALTALDTLALGRASEDYQQEHAVQQAAKHLTNLTHLTQLRLLDVMLNAAGIQHIAALTALRVLDLSYNNMSGANLARLTNLTQLSLHFAASDAETLRHLAPLTQLRDLDLSGSKLELTEVVHLSSLVSLTRLSLCELELDGSCIGALGALRDMEVLEINMARVNGPDAAALSSLTKLHTLHCRWNNLGVEGAVHLSKCKRLRSLHACANQLGPAGLQHLLCLTGLLELGIEDNVLGPDAAAHIAQSLTALTTLRISGNDIGPSGAAHIASMTQLHALDIRHCGLDTDSLQLLISLLPKLRNQQVYGSPCQ